MDAVRWRVAIFCLPLVLGSLACSGDDPVEPEPLVDAEDVAYAPELGVDLGAMTRLDSGVFLKDLLVPEDQEAPGIQVFDFLWVTYSGWLSDGTQFADEQATGRFRIGAGEVISGWDLGLIGTRQGGTRRLVIPPAHAYGILGSGTLIPPNAVLVFEWQVDSIAPPS